MTKEDINNFAIKKGCNLSDDELDFTYFFIKKNWQDILKRPNLFNIDKYKNHYSEDNFKKIKQVYKEYYQKFSSFV